MNTTDDVVQTPVREHDGIHADHVFKTLAPPLPRYTSNFEDIGKVGGKTKSEWDIDCMGSVVDQFKPLIADTLPQELGPQYMQRPTRNDHLAVPRNVHIGQIRRKL